MRRLVVMIAAAAIASGFFGSAGAETARKNPAAVRPARRTVIEPTKTIIHNVDGSTTVIVVPRRSYLNPGTEVPLGEPSHLDYAFPPAGDPGRLNWFYGPDHRGEGSFPLPPPLYIPGLDTRQNGY